jgi:hypothetical protein
MMLSISSEWKNHRVYTRVAIVGLLLITLSSTVFSILTLIDGDAVTLGGFVIFMALSVLFAALM